MTFRFLRPDSHSAWQNKEIQKRFSRYRAIIDDKEIARYLIAKTIPCDYSNEASLENLVNLVQEKAGKLKELSREGKGGNRT